MQTSAKERHGARTGPGGTPHPLALAGGPETPAEALQDLAGFDDEDVRRAVARHPNTPVEVLLKLAEDVPGAFLQNPVVALLFLEDPAFVERMSTQALQGILRHPGVSPAWLSQASRHLSWLVRRAVAKHEAVPAPVIAQLAKDENAKVCLAAAENPAFTASMVSLLVRFVLRAGGGSIYGHIRKEGAQDRPLA